MASLNSSYFSSDSDPSFRTLPLINHKQALLYTFQDLLKPGPQDVLQSTLPFYQIAIFTACLVLWIVLLVYFWKFVYYEVNDPYAVPLDWFIHRSLKTKGGNWTGWNCIYFYFQCAFYFLPMYESIPEIGSAPPWEKRMNSLAWNSNKILDYINNFSEKIHAFGASPSS